MPELDFVSFFSGFLFSYLIGFIVSVINYFSERSFQLRRQRKSSSK